MILSGFVFLCGFFSCFIYVANVLISAFSILNFTSASNQSSNFSIIIPPEATEQPILYRIVIYALIRNEEINTVECRYNAVQYNKILHTALQWRGQNINRRLNLQNSRENWPRYNGTKLYSWRMWHSNFQQPSKIGFRLEHVISLKQTALGMGASQVGFRRHDVGKHEWA